MTSDAVRHVIGHRPDAEASAVLVRLTGPDGTSTIGSGTADPDTGAPSTPASTFASAGLPRPSSP